MMIRIATILIAALTAIPSIQAMMYGNPVPREERRGALDFSYATMTRDLYIEQSGTDAITISRLSVSWEFSLAARRTLQIGGSTVTAEPDTGDSFSGAEVATSYRGALGGGFDMGGEQALLGLMASFRYGTVYDSVGGIDYTQVDVGVGTSIPMSAGMNLYAGGVYSGISGTRWYDDFDITYAVESDSDIGVFGGVEFIPEDNPDLTYAVELHAVHEFGLAAQLKFLF